MKVPKEIAEKAREYEEAMKVANQAYGEVTSWLKENTGIEGVYISDLFITDAPSGDNQGEGEYCDQWEVGYCGDSFEGTYYHPIEGSDNYMAYRYEC